MNHRTLLFLDNTYPQPYQLASLEEKPMGGTEASVIRVAFILSKLYRVYVAQKFRHHMHTENPNLQFIAKSDMHKLKPDCVIVLRKYDALKSLHKLFPQARLFLWLHTYKNYEYVLKKIGLNTMQAEIVCNSHTHKLHTSHLLNTTAVAKLLGFFISQTKVHCCYNPIIKPKPVNTEKDLNKLLFFSSPNKGLEQVIATFKQVQKFMPELCLYIANPGYKAEAKRQAESNIIYLGSLPHAQMMQHVRESLCVFYPQQSFAETFGLIYAEAHAHGTAIIAADIGTAKEIMHPLNQPIDVTDIALIVATLQQWQTHYPQVAYNEKFSDAHVLKQWQQVLFAT